MAALTAISACLALVMTGAMTGIFAAFSLSVMPGLDVIDPREAVRAMRGINVKILNRLFLVTFSGAPVAAVITGGLLLALGHPQAAVAFFLSGVVYFLGALLTTMVVNVPMNNALEAATVPGEEQEAAALWAGYSPRWTRWNNLRAAASAVALLLAGLGLYLWGVAVAA
jgi:uncharacterized membrane protein